MATEKSEKYWKKMSDTIEKAEDTTNKRLDMSQFDCDFILKHVDADSEVIDIGSGSGLVVNRIYNHVKNLIAVETFSGLAKLIVDDPKVMVINASLYDFSIRREFDYAICTGTSQFFKRLDIIQIYKNIFSMLKNNGSFLMRSHCGLNETVVVNGYSEELDTDYFAEFRHIDKEVELLKEIGFKSVEVKMLPDEYNAWENTKQFHIVCKK